MYFNSLATLLTFFSLRFLIFLESYRFFVQLFIMFAILIYNFKMASCSGIEPPLDLIFTEVPDPISGSLEDPLNPLLFGEPPQDPPGSLDEEPVNPLLFEEIPEDFPTSLEDLESELESKNRALSNAERCQEIKQDKINGLLKYRHACHFDRSQDLHDRTRYAEETANIEYCDAKLKNALQERVMLRDKISGIKRECRTIQLNITKLKAVQRAQERLARQVEAEGRKIAREKRAHEKAFKAVDKFFAQDISDQVVCKKPKI